MLLPWHTRQHAQVLKMLRANRVPHALLLRGTGGVGKRHFASFIAQVLLCSDAALEQRPCRKCRGCQLFEAHTHPDLHLLEIPEGKQSIGVDSVRALIDSLGLTSQFHGFKVVLAEPADAMTPAAANSLLKTLEEPPGDTVFLLISRHSALLPATIRSRCQSLQFASPPAAIGRAWLAQELDSGADVDGMLRIARGAPLLARTMAGEGRDVNRTQVVAELQSLLTADANTLQVASRWTSLGLDETVYWLLDCCMSLLRQKALGERHPTTGTSTEERFDPVLTALGPRQLFALLDVLIQIRGLLARPIGLNAQLTTEGMAIEIAGLADR